MGVLSIIYRLCIISEGQWCCEVKSGLWRWRSKGLSFAGILLSFMQASSPQANSPYLQHITTAYEPRLAHLVRLYTQRSPSASLHSIQHLEKPKSVSGSSISQPKTKLLQHGQQGFLAEGGGFCRLLEPISHTYAPCLSWNEVLKLTRCRAAFHAVRNAVQRLEKAGFKPIKVHSLLLLVL